MADDKAPDNMQLTARDIANVASGALADLAAFMRAEWPLDPRTLMMEMERIAGFMQRLPVPQHTSQSGQAPEARPN